MKHKNIFITGGNRGMGKGLVNLLGKDNNIVFSVRDMKKGEKTLLLTIINKDNRRRYLGVKIN